MTLKNLFVVIPVFNRWEQTRCCLQKLMDSSYKNFSVIVVDHGSSDGTREGLENEFPDVTRLPGTADMWWSAATNLGIRHALDRHADAVMLLNNDCYLEEATLERLLTQLHHAGMAVIAPLQRNLQTGYIQTKNITTCFILGFQTLRLPGRSLYRPNHDHPTEASLLIGGRGAIIPAEVFEKTGMLNEQELPHYGADHDFYLRCRKNAIPLLVSPNAIVDIDEDTTTLSARLGEMTFSDFTRSLRDRRSHRNLTDLTTLFRLHYPIPGLYPVGVSLNLLRYSMVYLAARLAQILGLYRK